MKNEIGTTDKIVLTHLKTNLPAVIEVATGYCRNMGDITKLDTAVATMNPTLFNELRNENEEMIDAILEAEY